MADEKKTRQVPLRLKPSLVDAIDVARAPERDEKGKVLSRTTWIERAIHAFLPKSLSERLAAEDSGNPPPESAPDVSPAAPPPPGSNPPGASKGPPARVGGGDDYEERVRELMATGTPEAVARRLARP